MELTESTGAQLLWQLTNTLNYTGAQRVAFDLEPNQMAAWFCLCICASSSAENGEIRKKLQVKRAHSVLKALSSYLCNLAWKPHVWALGNKLKGIKTTPMLYCQSTSYTLARALWESEWELHTQIPLRKIWKTECTISGDSCIFKVGL